MTRLWLSEPGGQFVSGMAKATKESGLRGKLAKSVMDCGTGLPAIWQKTMQEELDQQIEDLERFHNTADGRVQDSLTTKSSKQHWKEKMRLVFLRL